MDDAKLYIQISNRMNKMVVDQYDKKNVDA